MPPGAAARPPDPRADGGTAIRPPEFAELLHALPVATLLIDGAERVAYANAAAEALLNQSERAMAGRPIGELMALPQGYSPRGQGFAAFDVDVPIARGGTLRLDVADAALPDRPSWRVVTLHGRAGHRLGQSIERSGSARAAVGAAAMLGHEIKNPLSGIRGAAQLLAHEGGSAELTGLITAEVDRIAALIDRMQPFSDTRPPPLAPAGLYPLLDRARRLARAGFAADVVIEERFDPSLPPVMANADLLLQVVLNLLKNASEALVGRADARIVIATAYRAGMTVATADRGRVPLPIELRIADNGPGVPAELADSLFDPFVSGRREGQGLGLALVDKLVRDMGGMVSHAREGDPPMTVFRILLARGEG